MKEIALEKRLKSLRQNFYIKTCKKVKLEHLLYMHIYEYMNRGQWQAVEGNAKKY